MLALLWVLPSLLRQVVPLWAFQRVLAPGLMERVHLVPVPEVPVRAQELLVRGEQGQQGQELALAQVESV